MFQELVFIGVGLKHGAIQEALDKCLLTDEEMTLGPEGWQQEFVKLRVVFKLYKNKLTLCQDSSDSESDEENASDEERQALVYKCKITPGCIKNFRRFNDYQAHKRELCLVPEEKQSSSNQLIARYIAKNGIT